MGMSKEIANVRVHVHESRTIEDAMVFMRRLMENGRQFAVCASEGGWEVSTPVGNAPSTAPRGAPPSGGSPAAGQPARLAA